MRLEDHSENVPVSEPPDHEMQSSNSADKNAHRMSLHYSPWMMAYAFVQISLNFFFLRNWKYDMITPISDFSEIHPRITSKLFCYTMDTLCLLFSWLIAQTLKNHMNISKQFQQAHSMITITDIFVHISSLWSCILSFRMAILNIAASCAYGTPKLNIMNSRISQSEMNLNKENPTLCTNCLWNVIKCF